MMSKVSQLRCKIWAGDGWVYDPVWAATEGMGNNVMYVEEFGDEPTYWDADMLCRATGLADKDSKRIYEGDVVSWYNGDTLSIVRFGPYDNGDYGDHCCGVGFYMDYVAGGFDEPLCEDNIWALSIVGNIHENPELLAEGGQ